MIRKNRMQSNVAVLVVAVLAILALIRGKYQIWLLCGAFAVWLVWVILPHFKEIRQRSKMIRIKPESEGFTFPEEPSDSVSTVLLRHANFRISAYLKAIYPDAAWEWCEELPEKIIAKGGTGRVRLFHVPDFNYADVTFNQEADIRCSLLKIVPLAELRDSDGEKQVIPARQDPIDPQVWYEIRGRKILDRLIADLGSRGHSSLTIHENGEISIRQSGDDVMQAAFEGLPGRLYWPRLIKVFEREGYAAAEQESGLVLSW